MSTASPPSESPAERNAHQAAPPDPVRQAENPKRLVLRNTLTSFVAQVIGTPLSIAVTAMIARHAGAGSFGDLYVASTMAGLGFLFVDWGQGSVMAGRIARDRSSAGELLGTALVWKVTMAFVAYGVLATVAALRYSVDFQVVLLLVAIQALATHLTNACYDSVRGFERMDIGAYGQVAQPLLSLAIVVPTLLLGGGLLEALLAQIAVQLLLLGYVWQARKRVGIRSLRVRLDTLRILLRDGASFLVFSVSMVVQPIVDALLLKELTPADVVGWHAAARRIVGTLVVPGSILIGVLYPTLSRLHSQDRAAFDNMVRASLRATIILAFPLALGCAMYADLGVLIFSKRSYSGAEANLQVMAPFAFLMYFSMPLGIALLASGQQRIWAAVQGVSLVVCSVLDVLLIGWFQRRYGNGGLGVCAAALGGELLMVAAGVWLTPKAVFDRAFWLTLLRGTIAGAAFVATALLLSSLPSLVAAPLAVVAYFGVLFAIGGLGSEQLAMVRDAISRKVALR